MLVEFLYHVKLKYQKRSAVDVFDVAIGKVSLLVLEFTRFQGLVSPLYSNDTLMSLPFLLFFN